jgi:hypothetical protein
MDDILFTERIEKEKGKRMSIVWLFLIIGIWLFLQAYILPKLGVST